MTVDPSWTQMQETAFGSSFGQFRLIAYEFADGSEHVALIFGEPAKEQAPLVRVQSSCLTGTAFAARLCDCKQQLDLALDSIVKEGAGIVLYMDQEGRGYGLVEKVRQLSLISSGLATTATAAPPEDEGADRRGYTHAFAILDSLIDTKSLLLLTNNPKKIDAFTEAGYDIKRVSLETPPTESNREYLRIKKEFMGHLLTTV